MLDILGWFKSVKAGLIEAELPHDNQSLLGFLASSPLAGMKLDLDRVPDYGREVDL